MYAVELQFDLQTRRASYARLSKISSLIAALVKNGNLLDQYVLTAESKKWTVHGMTPARDAFRKANWNSFVQQEMVALAKANLEHPRIRFLGIVPETAPACRCSKPRGFYLFTTFLQLEPPVRCIHCSGTVPLYRLPSSKTGEHFELRSWASNYQSCDTLQMNSSVGTRFGERQMSDPTSSLSRTGLAVCRELEGLTGRPVYYYLYRGNAQSRPKELRRACPACGGQWLLKKPLHGKFDFKCNHCRLLSNIAWNVR